MILGLLLLSILSVTLGIQRVKASGTVYIRSDGSIDPTTAPIQRVEDYYTLTGNISSDTSGIVVEKSNIVIDGAGYAIIGTGIDPQIGIDLWSRHNVTIKNLKITDNWFYGVALYQSSNNKIIGNAFVDTGLFVQESYDSIVKENLVNGKPLVYLEGVSNHIIEDAGQVVLVNCNGIMVESLDLSHTCIGIELYKTSNTRISGNNITNNWTGIWLWESSNNNSIFGNNIVENDFAGVRLVQSSNNNSILGNNIAVSNEYGIELWGSSTNNSILHNNLTRNDVGIGFWDSFDNYVVRNNVTNNQCGILFPGSSGNVMHHNNFIYNTKNIETIAPSTNGWDDGYPSGGNYWSDYTGVDEKSGPNQDQSGSDGIGDTPYYITLENQDHYPFMSPLELIQPITFHDYDNSWHSADFTITLIATDNSGHVAETYYRINSGPTKTVSADSQPFITTEGAHGTLEYWSVDDAGNEELPHRILTGIKLDKTPPAGFIVIKNNATYTNSTSVKLALTSTDATSGVVQMRFSNDNLTWSEWDPYATTKSWTLLTEDGTKCVSVQYRDNSGLTSSFSDSIVLDTKKPTASAGNDQTITEDTFVTFDASASTDENGIATYTWTFTDVQPQSLIGKNPKYRFTDPGIYVVTLKVTDPVGNTANDTAVIVVTDITKPVAHAEQDQTVYVSESATFDASASADNVGIVSYEWDFGDGATGTGKTTTHEYAEAGTYTVTLTVEDAAGNQALETVIVTVNIMQTFPWSIVAAATIIAASIVAGIAILWRIRKKATR
jgi:parallel beta-helix repeat protein